MSEPITARIVAMTRAHIALALPYEDQLFGAEAWTTDSYAAELADTKHRFYIAAVRGDQAGDEQAGDEQAGDELLGWAGLMTLGETSQILTIGVVPDAQRHGIGQAMLDALLQEAARRGATEVFLEVRVDNQAALRMYERNGFTQLRIRRGYYELGRVDAVEMRREL